MFLIFLVKWRSKPYHVLLDVSILLIVIVFSYYCLYIKIMLCDVCGKREAAIHIQQIIGTEVIDLHLCRQCARDKNIPETEGSVNNSIINMVKNLLDGTRLTQFVDQKNTYCPTCNTKLHEIRETGKAGCPDCYREFRTVIRETLGAGNNPLLHNGNIPYKLKSYKTILVDRERLKKELEEAVFKEDYETAVVIRDKLKELEIELGRGNE